MIDEVHLKILKDHGLTVQIIFPNVDISRRSVDFILIEDGL